MLGAASRSCRPDFHTGCAGSPGVITRSLTSVNLDGNPTESYLGTTFCRTLGRGVRGTLADSWAFYRDLFAVVDNDWFDLLWFKNLSSPDAAVRSGVRETLSQAFWERLVRREASLQLEIPAVDPDVASLAALAGLSDASTFRHTPRARRTNLDHQIRRPT